MTPVKRRYLVLGGSGFIGSHVVLRLAELGHRVRVLDRAELPAELHQPGIEYRRVDFADIPSVAEGLADVDCVLHLVSTTVPGTANLDPIADVEGNLIGSIRLLQQMREVDIKRLVFLSSGGTIYGDPTITPVPEEHCIAPLSSYGIVKASIEAYLSMFARLSDFRNLVLRVSNPYGARQGHVGVQGVIPTFFQRIREDRPIRIWGDGSAVRDYLYIDDLAEAIVAATTREIVGTFNIGSGVGTSLADLLSLIARVSGRTPHIEYVPSRGFDVRSIVLDISKAHRVFQWQPQVLLEEGCRRYWEWLERESGSVD
jgi:UDP-glucose 4-epimerase